MSPGGPVPLEELESGTRMTSSLQRTKNKQIWNLRVIRFLLFLKGTFMENSMISYDFFVSEDLKPPTSHPRCSFNELSQQEPHVCTVAIELRVEDRIATPNFKTSTER